MAEQLETIFRELGISQYLGVFLDQGFDSWDTILDITESDLDALGVKLGHRRKLQRRIANTRGLSADVSLGSIVSTRPSIEDTRSDIGRRRASVESRDSRNPREHSLPVISKRKYRRHPKPDENAPERPPSAYVLFSNKMREELKGRNLTFTEIAKLVGENWQSLSQSEKEPFETQAQRAKEKYNNDLTEYKKTTEYQKYMSYLQDFRAKHATDQEGSKRAKLNDTATQSQTETNSSNDTPNRTSSGSGSESQAGNDSVPIRQRRCSSHHDVADDSATSPFSNHFERQQERSPSFSPREMAPMLYDRHPKRDHNVRADAAAVCRHLPAFSDVFEGQLRHNGEPRSESSSNGVMYREPRPSDRRKESPGPVPGLVADRRPPPLRSELSSLSMRSSGASSNASSSSSYGYPRTPSETSATLPVHSLLTSKPLLYDEPMTTGGQGEPLPSQLTLVHNGPPDAPSKENGARLAMVPSPAMGHRKDYRAYSIPTGPPRRAPPARPDTNLDGMSALLKAGELVGRHATR